MKPFNTHYDGLIRNKNFQNNQNYVFPQKDSIFREVRMSETLLLGMKPRYFFLCFIASFLLIFITKYLGFLFICMLLYGLLFVLISTFIIVLQFLNYMTLESFFYKMYVLCFKIYQKFYQKKIIRVYFLGRGIYLIHKGKGDFKKVFYVLERFKFIKHNIKPDSNFMKKPYF